MSNTILARKNRCISFWEKTPVERPLFGFGLHRRSDESIDPARLADEAANRFGETLLFKQDPFWAAEPPSAFPWVERAMTSGTILYGRVIDAMVDAAKGRFPIAQAELHGPTTVLRALFGADGLADRLNRDAGTAAALVSDIVRVRDSLWEMTVRTSRFEGGSVLGVLHLWAPGTCMLLRDDGAGLFGSAEYARLFLPSVKRSAEKADFAVYALGPDCLHVIDAVLELDPIRCINFCLDDESPPLIDVIPLLRRIQERGRCLAISGPMNKEDLDSILGGLSYRGLYLNLTTGTPVEARFWSQYIVHHSKDAAI